MLRLSTDDRVLAVKLHHKVGNFQEVRRRWAAFSRGRCPSAKAVREVVEKFEREGTVLNLHRGRSGRPRTVRTQENREAVAEALQRSPRKSTRRASVELHISQRTILRLYRDLRLKPWRPRLVQKLLPDDTEKRLEFAQELLEMAEDEPDLWDRIIWSDEASFKLNGHVNRHNCIFWSADNPHLIMEEEVNATGVTVWAGVWSQGLIGPFFFTESVNGDRYLDMLEENFWPVVAEAAENEDEPIFFQHDGAPPHYRLTVRNWLHEHFPRRWIGRGGSIPWPPRSPDLTPPDFFLWGVLKDIVYATRPPDVEDLKQRITQAMAAIPVHLCEKVCRSVPDRLRRCVEADGGHLELELNTGETVQSF